MAHAYTKEQELFSKEELDKITEYINDNGWNKGYRNNMAVNISCYCHVLSIDIHHYLKNEIRDCMKPSDIDDFIERTDLIACYIDRWDTLGTNGVLSYTV